MVRTLAVLGLGYAATVALAAIFQRRLQYFPMGAVRTPSAAGVPEMRVVALCTDDGLDLRAWWAPPAPGRATLVYFPGNAGNLSFRAPLVRPYLDAGLGVLLIAWRGFEGNPGQPTEAGLYRDAHAALAFLRAQAIAPQRTVLYGESLGTAVAVQVASETTVAAVILDAPFTSLVDVAAHHFWFLPVRPLMRDRYESAARIAALGAPLLILHGSRDTVVPIEFGRRLFDAAAEPKAMVVIEGAGHTGLAQVAAAQVLDFIARHCP